jgi:predicted lipase
MIDDSTIQFLMGVAKDAYTLPADVEDPRTGASAILSQEGDDAVIGFRGTDSPIDWVYDIMRWRRSKALPGGGTCKVHAGFDAQLRSILPQIVHRLSKLDRLDTIYLTGHSLGGAMATLASAELTTMFPGCQIRVLAVGSPRCADRCFRDWYERTPSVHIQRIQHGYDIVSKVPWFGYCHVGSVQYPRNPFSFLRLTRNHSINSYMVPPI